MKANERTLQGLLRSAEQYVIPVFQRYYTWGTSQWDQLVDDILALLPPNDLKQRHFLGPIVTVADQHLPGGVSPFQVIDGQQRLTTLSILLCGLRDIARERNWSVAAQIDDYYLLHAHETGGDRYKVYPRQRDRESYLALVDGKLDSGSTGQPVLAYRYLRRRMEQVPEILDSEDVLKQVMAAIVTRLDFVAITLSGENPYKIFRSLNSTGADLSEADLIRNHVFMALPVAKQDKFDDERWQKLESGFIVSQKLSGRDFEAFIRDALMSVKGTYIKKDGLFEHFVERFPINGFSPETLVDELMHAAQLYHHVRGKQAHKDKAIESALKAIRALHVTTSYPLVLALMQRHAAGTLSQDDLLASLRSIASFVLRRLICGESSRAYSNWFVAACREIGAHPKKHVLDFFKRKGWPSDERFTRSFVQYNLYSSEYGREILEALEVASQAESEPVLLSGCSIEHVMPQSIDPDDDDGKAWLAALGPEWQRTHSAWLHSPGNLTLVGADYNSIMSNRAYVLKQPVLAESKVYLNKYFKAASGSWDQTSIQERGKSLAMLASQIWMAPPA